MSSEIRGTSRLDQLVALAEQCPYDYPQMGELGEVPAIKSLAERLVEFGYPHLAKAVGGGIAWHRRILSAKLEIDIRLLESDAAEPGYTWNRQPAISAALSEEGE